MKDEHNHRLIILAGPSCAGKTPLAKALGIFFPELKNSMRPLVLYNSRDPRPGETDGKDYHFRSRKEIEALKKKQHFIVLDVRGDLQAVDLNELKDMLKKDDVFFEGNPFVGRILQTHPELKHINKTGVFMAPLSRDEILFLRDIRAGVSLPELVTDIMRRRLLRRTRRQKGDLSLPDLENIERRASSAYHEMQDAHYFPFILPNHDGEDSENWDAFYYPIGDARKSLLAFVSVIRGESSEFLEKWEDDLLPA